MRAELASIPNDLRSFGKAAGRDGCISYELICLGLADDESVIELMGQAPKEQRRPNLLLAAVHYLLLRGARHELSEFYRTVRDERGEVTTDHGSDHDSVRSESGGQEAPIVSAFRDFAITFQPDIARLMATRSTQTNEVGRCNALLPALATQYARLGRPLALIDIGAAAGLNLGFDRYAYDYTRPNAPPLLAGPQSSEVQLVCQLRDGALPDLSAVEVGYRAGLDLAPIDPDDDDGAMWLLGCQWPDDLKRFKRMRGALNIARSDPDRPPVYQGDMLHDVAKAVDRVPDGLSVCLFHSWVAAYLDPGQQTRLVKQVRELAQHRDVTWLFAENPYEVPNLPTPPSPRHESTKDATVLMQITFDQGRPVPVRLADMHHHGRWLSWFGA